MAKKSEHAKDSSNYLSEVQNAIHSMTVAINGIRIFTFVSEKINQLKYNLTEADSHNPQPSNESESEEMSRNDYQSLTEQIKNKMTSVTRQLSVGIQSTQGMVVRLRTNTVTPRKKPPLKRASVSKSCLHGHHYSADDLTHTLQTSYQHSPRNIWEPYITKGYLLPYMPWSYYLRALYLPTFELFNIWTHLLPCLYFIYKLFEFSKNIDLVEKWPLLLINVMMIMVTLCSSLAHMFHNRSGFDHCWWFMVDYFGISSYAFGVTIVHFYSASKLTTEFFIGQWNLYLIVLICITGFICCCITQLSQHATSVKRARRIKLGVNGLGYFYGCVPLFHRLYLSLTESYDPIVVWNVITMTCMIVAPILYGRDIPQRFWPGKFNIIGHSHHIFHILTATAMYFDLHATYADITNPVGSWVKLASRDVYPSAYDVAGCYIVVTIVAFIITVFLRNLIKPDYDFEKDYREGRRLCLCGLPESCYESNCEISQSSAIDHMHTVLMYNH